MIRLLHIDTLEFKEFPRNPPPYAIAAHRWRDGEVTLQDMIERKGQIEHKSGYRKILGFCTALQTMLRLSPGCTSISWLWIDTCCIEKANLTELSEAVISMFRWYSNAEICLAYLDDVATIEKSPLTVIDSFRSSEWFSRCWTLQELIAPSNVVFFNQCWGVIGHKSSIEGTAFSMSAVGSPLNHWISECTGISESVLCDFGASKHLTVSEKMSWMKGRTTTRPEDIAYSQLGIFGVFMPLIYGEEFNASKRLNDAIKQKAQEELQISDHTDGREPSPLHSSLSGVLTRPSLGGSHDSSHHGEVPSKTIQHTHKLRKVKRRPYYPTRDEENVKLPEDDGQSTAWKGIMRKCKDVLKLFDAKFFARKRPSS